MRNDNESCASIVMKNCKMETKIEGETIFQLQVIEPFQQVMKKITGEIVFRVDNQEVRSRIRRRSTRGPKRPLPPSTRRRIRRKLCPHQVWP